MKLCLFAAFVCQCAMLVLVAAAPAADPSNVLTMRDFTDRFLHSKTAADIIARFGQQGEEDEDNLALLWFKLANIILPFKETVRESKNQFRRTMNLSTLMTTSDVKHSDFIDGIEYNFDNSLQLLSSDMVPSVDSEATSADCDDDDKYTYYDPDNVYETSVGAQNTTLNTTETMNRTNGTFDFYHSFNGSGIVSSLACARRFELFALAFGVVFTFLFA